MKRIISLVLLLIPAFAFAQNPNRHVTYSFLNASSVLVTNTLQVTNLASITATVTTNLAGTLFTNKAGSQIVASASNGGTAINLLQTVPLWGAGVFTPIYTNQAPGATQMPGPYNGAIWIRIKGRGAAANSAVTFTFAPVPRMGGTDTTAAGNLISVALTANGTTEVNSITPIDLNKTYGAGGLMCRTIVNGDGDAASAVDVLECSLVGFPPL